MPRIARGLAGGEIYHIINRGNRRAEIFHNTKDYSTHQRQSPYGQDDSVNNTT